MKAFPFIVLALLVAHAHHASADEHHYKDLMVGERAAGLAGAFVAISDDPSGVYHNPAGIAFNDQNYVSLSANAFSTSQIRFENIYPGQDYTYRSAGLLPVFFGFTQTMGRGKFGLAVVVPDAQSTDQNDTVTREASATAVALQFHRKLLQEDTTYVFGPGYALEISENVAIGASVFGMLRTTKLLDNTEILFAPLGTGKYYVQLLHLNKTAWAVLPKLGIQFMPIPKWSVGLTISKPVNVEGSGAARIAETKTGADGLPVAPTGNFDNDMKVTTLSNVFHQFPAPLSVSTAAAWFVSPELLVTAQVDYHFAEKSFKDYPIRAVLNWSAGMECYLSSSFAFRVGAYSDNAKTEALDTTRADQPPHVNLIGGTAGVSFHRTGTSLTLGVGYAKGAGEGQAFAGSTALQRMSHTRTSMFLSGSYQL